MRKAIMAFFCLAGALLCLVQKDDTGVDVFVAASFVCMAMPDSPKDKNDRD